MKADSDFDKRPLLPGELRIDYDCDNPILKEMVDELFSKLLRRRADISQTWSKSGEYLRVRLRDPRD